MYVGKPNNLSSNSKEQSMRNIISDIVIPEGIKEHVINKIALKIEEIIMKKKMEYLAITALEVTYSLKALGILDDAISSLEYKLVTEEKAIILSYENMLNILRDLYNEVKEQPNIIEIHEVNKDELKRIRMKNEVLNVQSLEIYNDKAIIFQIENKVEIYSANIVFSTISFKFQDTDRYWIGNIRDTSENPITVKLYKGTKEINYESFENKLKADYKELITSIIKDVLQLIKNKSI